jgi:hypothetical protein
MRDYITGPSTRPFVMYGAGGSGKSSMLSMTAYRAAYEWLAPAKPLLFVRFCGTTPNSTSLGPLLKSICQQISYTFLLPFQVCQMFKFLVKNNFATEVHPLLRHNTQLDLVGTPAQVHLPANLLHLTPALSGMPDGQIFGQK